MTYRSPAPRKQAATPFHDQQVADEPGAKIGAGRRKAGERLSTWTRTRSSDPNPQPQGVTRRARCLCGIYSERVPTEFAFAVAALKSHDVGMQHRPPKHEIPDKAASRPSVRRESAGFSSSLHDDLEGPRRCGTIAGCRAFKPTPGLACPAIPRAALANRARARGSD